MAAHRTGACQAVSVDVRCCSALANQMRKKVVGRTVFLRESVTAERYVMSALPRYMSDTHYWAHLLLQVVGSQVAGWFGLNLQAVLSQ